MKIVQFPEEIRPSEGLRKHPEPGKPLQGEDMEEFTREMTIETASILNLKEK